MSEVISSATRVLIPETMSSSEYSCTCPIRNIAGQLIYVPHTRISASFQSCNIVFDIMLWVTADTALFMPGEKASGQIQKHDVRNDCTHCKQLEPEAKGKREDVQAEHVNMDCRPSKGEHDDQ